MGELPEPTVELQPSEAAVDRAPVVLERFAVYLYTEIRT
jgi:hypothetical protein